MICLGIIVKLNMQGDREICIYPQSDLLSRAEQACSFLKAATAILCAANSCSLPKGRQASGVTHNYLISSLSTHMHEML